MFWLDLNLPLSDEFEVEKQVRYIQGCSDLHELRALCVALLRFTTQQTHVSNQLVHQVAAMEQKTGCPVTPEHEAWAAEILASQRASS